MIRKKSRPKKTSKKSPADLLAKYFDQDGLRYGREELESGETIFMGVMGGFKDPFPSFNFFMIVEEDIIKGMAVLPFSITEDSRMSIAELITRINCRLKYGRFEMDFEDGGVRCRVGLPVAGLNGNVEKYVRLLLHLPVEIISDWARAFCEVAIKHKAPKRIESKYFKRLGI